MGDHIPAIVTAVTGAVLTVLTGVLTWWGTYRATVDRAKTEAEGKAADREERAYVAAYQEAMNAHKQHIQSLCEENADQHLQITKLQEDNVECRELAVRQGLAIDVLYQMHERTNRALEKAGIEPEPLLELPDFRPHDQQSEGFAKRQGEHLEKIARQAVEKVSEDAKKVLPPEPPCDTGS